jgi:hypothetical protein
MMATQNDKRKKRRGMDYTVNKSCHQAKSNTQCRDPINQ